ncbi:unnamed protein product [Rotaria sordida]|uniref:Uncharacterized protein n=1 Tax=Rotaria sordida TaxID=392033 RepID=A0A819VL81_9BILA|nr:unnamed protein product [Rotaria sordida]
MSLIYDVLATDTKVKPLWLKRNPILATGVVHFARMLPTNNYLKTLDLLNTGLLGEASNCIDSDVARPLVDAFIDYLSLEQLNLGYMKATILLGGLDNVIEDEGAAEISRLILHLMVFHSED